MKTKRLKTSNYDFFDKDKEIFMSFWKWVSVLKAFAKSWDTPGYAKLGRWDTLKVETRSAGSLGQTVVYLTEICGVTSDWKELHQVGTDI